MERASTPWKLDKRTGEILSADGAVIAEVIWDSEARLLAASHRMYALLFRVKDYADNRICTDGMEWYEDLEALLEEVQ